jgi:hypothetical protein
MQMTATVWQVGQNEPVQSKAGKTYDKVTVIVETSGAYPKKTALTFFGKSAEIGLSLVEGQTRTFHLETESRENNGRWYSEIKCFKVEP